MLRMSSRNSRICCEDFLRSQSSINSLIKTHKKTIKEIVEISTLHLECGLKSVIDKPFV